MITGIAGFIGFHTAIKFMVMGHEVVGFDNYNEYYDPKLKNTRANILSRLYGVNIFNMDLRSATSLKQTVADYDPDLVIHLAAMAGVRHSMDHDMDYIDNNIVGTRNLIKALESAHTQNVIYASTSCVMHGHELPWREYETFHPQLNPYGYSKFINESQFEISNIPNAVGMRFFTVYGPYGRPDMALFDFTKSIIEDRPITLFNYGDMKRDFTYVDDIVHGIEVVSNNMTMRDMYNVGRGEQVELMRFVKAIESSLGKTAEILYEPKHPADAKETWSDTTKLQSIGYNPTISIEDGVDKFVRWYTEYYNEVK